MSAVCAACGAPNQEEQATCPNCGNSPEREHEAWSKPRVQGRVPENLAAAAAYVSVFPAIIFLLLKPYSRNAFIRFHAFQCLWLGAGTVALGLLLLLLANLLSFNLLLIPLSIIAFIGIALVLLVCMIKAYQHQNYKLPLIGNWAERHALDS